MSHNQKLFTNKSRIIFSAIKSCHESYKFMATTHISKLHRVQSAPDTRLTQQYTSMLLTSSMLGTAFRPSRILNCKMVRSFTNFSVGTCKIKLRECYFFLLTKISFYFSASLLALKRQNVLKCKHTVIPLNRRFIKHFSDISKALFRLTKNGVLFGGADAG